ncbi:MAG TPA: hypothetical protein ENI72_02405 [Rhodospirillales bacterium]|nr:hypothetical protein [Rhodospirillales bacterium]
MADITFEIFRDGTEIPVIYTEEVLNDFRANKIDLIDRQLTSLCNKAYEDAVADGDDARLGVIGPLIREGLDDANNSQVAQCILWLAVRHPEITGLDILLDHYQFRSLSGPNGSPPTIN